MPISRLGKALARLRRGRISVRIDHAFRRRINNVPNLALNRVRFESEKGRMPGVRIYDAAKYRDDPKAIAQYLNDALSTEDPFLITRAVGTMVRAQGITRFSRKAGMRRDSLAKMLTGEVSPAFDTVMKLLIALDIQLVAKPAAELKATQAKSVFAGPDTSHGLGDATAANRRK
jgi:probable addiction module antidote protein